MAAADSFYTTAQRRVEIFTLALGAAATLYCGFRWGGRAAAGLAVGAALSWVNYRWLRQAVEAMGMTARAPAGTGGARAPTSVFVKFFGRLALLLLALYVILSRSWFPAQAVVTGLLTVAAGAVAEMMYELSGFAKRPDVP